MFFHKVPGQIDSIGRPAHAGFPVWRTDLPCDLSDIANPTATPYACAPAARRSERSFRDVRGRGSETHQGFLTLQVDRRSISNIGPLDFRPGAHLSLAGS